MFVTQGVYGVYGVIIHGIVFLLYVERRALASVFRLHKVVLRVLREVLCTLRRQHLRYAAALAMGFHHLLSFH